MRYSCADVSLRKNKKACVDTVFVQVNGFVPNLTQALRSQYGALGHSCGW